MGNVGMIGQCYFHMYDVKNDTIYHFIPGPDDFPWLKEYGSAIHDIGYVQNIIWSGGSNGLVGFDISTNKYINDSLFYPTSKALQDISYQ